MGLATSSASIEIIDVERRIEANWFESLSCFIGGQKNPTKYVSEIQSVLPPVDSNSVPVCLRVKRTGQFNANGLLAKCNNILSGCTLTIWPWISSTEYTYDITLVTPAGEKRGRVLSGSRSWFSILPLGAIPVPGLGDKRAMYVGPIGQHAYESITRTEDEIVKGETLRLLEVNKNFIEDCQNNPGKYVAAIVQMRTEISVRQFNDANASNGGKIMCLMEVPMCALEKLNYSPVLILRADEITDKKILAHLLADSNALKLVGPEESKRIRERLKATQ